MRRRGPIEPQLVELSRSLSWLVETWGSRDFRVQVAGETGLDLGPTETRLLWHLGNADGQRPSDLARRLDLGASGATKAIARTRARGLIDQVGDQADARANRVVLTEQGRAALRSLEHFSVGFLSELLIAWDDEAIRDLTEALHRFVDVAGEPIGPSLDAYVTRPTERTQPPVK